MYPEYIQLQRLKGVCLRNQFDSVAVYLQVSMGSSLVLICCECLLQLMQAGLGMWPPRPDLHSHVLSMRAAGKTWPPPPTGWAAVFRQSSMRCNAQMDSIVCMLCDDKPHAFGAPDVLQALAHDVTLVHAVEYKYPKTAPETADRLHVQGGLGLSILNNSNSKWEVLMEPWPLLVALSNPINPLVKSDRTL